MRYPASEKREIIRLVERSHLPTKRTLTMLGVPRTTFYRWYDRYIACLRRAKVRLGPTLEQCPFVVNRRGIPNPAAGF